MNLIPVTIRENGVKLAGTFILPRKVDNKLPAVIFYHGMVSRSKPRYVKRAQALARRGIAGFVFDFRGCGESVGKVEKSSLSDWLIDGLATFDSLLKQDWVDPERIGIAGKSFGGYIAALVSEKRKVKSMVLQAPAVYDDSWFDISYSPTDWDRSDFRERRTKYRNSEEALNNKAISAIKKFRGPLLVVGSEKDDICPKQIVEGYYRLSGTKNKKLIWIKGADHPLTKEKWNKEYTKIMTDWFRKTL